MALLMFTMGGFSKKKAERLLDGRTWDDMPRIEGIPSIPFVLKQAGTKGYPNSFERADKLVVNGKDKREQREKGYSHKGLA